MPEVVVKRMLVAHPYWWETVSCLLACALGAAVLILDISGQLGEARPLLLPESTAKMHLEQRLILIGSCLVLMASLRAARVFVWDGRSLKVFSSLPFTPQAEIFLEGIVDVPVQPESTVGLGRPSSRADFVVRLSDGGVVRVPRRYCGAYELMAEMSVAAKNRKA